MPCICVFLLLHLTGSVAGVRPTLQGAGGRDRALRLLTGFAPGGHRRMHRQAVEDREAEEAYEKTDQKCLVICFFPFDIWPALANGLKAGAWATNP